MLSADGRASASKVEKRPKKSKLFSILDFVSKVEVHPNVECLWLFDASYKT
jgi:hypothetical protein